MSDGWGTPVHPGDALRQLQRRVMRQERRSAVRSLDATLGDGMAALAVQIVDWNATDTLLNGFYYSAPGAVNTPDTLLSWTGQTIAKDDGTGMQQVWNTDGPSTLYWMRTYVPTPEEDGNVIFSAWKRFATPSGYIDEPELSPGVNDNIATALANATAALAAAEEAMDFATSSTRVFRQAAEPTEASVGAPLQDGWVWVDTDNGNALYIYDESTADWEPADNALLASLEADLAAAQSAADAAQADASQAILDAAAAQSSADTAATNAGNALSAAAAAQADADEALGYFPITATNISDDAITTPKLEANAITSKHTITGAVFQTEATASRGIKISSTGLTVYNGSGSPTLTITASTGAIAMLGSLTSGSTITGATVTGGTLQTEATAARGIKITSTGLIAYDGAGATKVTLTNLGALTVDGPVMTGGTITGAVLQTSATAATGVKITTSGGIVGYGGGVAKFTLDTSGNLTVSGAVATGGTIDGAVITGGTIQTNSSTSPLTGIKMNSTGFTAYNASGSPTFTITASTGAVAMLGTLTSGSTITGATITGGIFRTAATGERIVIDAATGYETISFFTGDSAETTAGRIVGGINSPFANRSALLQIETASLQAGFANRARISMTSGSADSTVAPTIVFNGDITVANDLDINGDLSIDGVMKNGFQVGASASRTTIIHSASINLTVSGANGIATWNHGLALGTLTYQVFVTSRNNTAPRMYTVTAKNANTVDIEIKNPSTNAVIANGGTSTVDILIIG